MSKYILCLLILLIVVPSIAQENDELKFGVKSGLNYSKFNSDFFNNEEIFDYRGKVGFYLGGYLNYSISEKIKFQPELLFGLQGSRSVDVVELRLEADEPPLVGELTTRFNESTLMLPLMMQLYVTNTLYVELGPQLGYIVSNTTKTVDNPFEDIDDIDFDSDEVISCKSCDKFEVGISLGLGLNVNESIGLNLRYYRGLTKRDIFEKSLSVFNLGVNYKI